MTSVWRKRSGVSVELLGWCVEPAGSDRGESRTLKNFYRPIPNQIFHDTNELLLCCHSLGVARGDRPWHFIETLAEPKTSGILQALSFAPGNQRIIRQRLGNRIGTIAV